MERCWTCHGQGSYATENGAVIGCVYCKGSGVKWEVGEVYQRIAELEQERDRLQNKVTRLQKKKEHLEWIVSQYVYILNQYRK